MERHIVRILFVILMVFAFCTDAKAVPPEDIDRPPSKGQFEKVRKRIETLRMWKLTQALDLDEKTSSQLFPVLSKYDKKRAEIEKSMREGMKELREAVKEKREGNLKSILDRLEQNHSAMQTLNDEERAELKKILTIEQQAKYVIFQQEFDREIRKIIAESREKLPERLRKERGERPIPPERPLPPER